MKSFCFRVGSIRFAVPSRSFLPARRSVALVSHRSSPKIFGYQKQLITELKCLFPKRLMHFPVLLTRQEPLRVHEHTQRSRSFLYAALACVVAQLFGKTRIRFFENGVVSINLPISEQVVGARATRTTHPLVLERFRRFFSAAVGEPVEVENPFVWKTKTDVIRSIVDHGCGPLIKHTVSCTRSYDITRLHTHCGCCSQCLDRRFAILAADAAEHDPVEMYKVELLTGPRERPNDQTMAESYVRTALELRDMDERQFFDRFGGETSRVCSGFSALKSDDVARQVLDLHHRHGQAIVDVLNAVQKPQRRAGQKECADVIGSDDDGWPDDDACAFERWQASRSVRTLIESDEERPRRGEVFDSDPLSNACNSRAETSAIKALSAQLKANRDLLGLLPKSGVPNPVTS